MSLGAAGAGGCDLAEHEIGRLRPDIGELGHLQRETLDLLLAQALDHVRRAFGPERGHQHGHHVEDWLRAELFKRGYDIVYTPHIMRRELWNTSGHTGFYKDNMFGPVEVEKAEYQLKPMNCPGHILIYKSKLRSYRDLPVRLAELGTVYRYERSGVLHGLLRVRGFTQDDAHIFCTPQQIESEVEACIDFAYAVHTDVGNTAVGCKINGKMAPLVSELANGDEVEILTSKAQMAPPSAWESIVVTGKARAAIRRAIC